MNKIIKLFLLILFGFTLNIRTAYSQVVVEITIENQEVVGTDFFFDIYLRATSVDNLYLDNADFRLTFATGNFTDPVLTKIGPSPGNCTFVPTDQSGSNTSLTRDGYYTRTLVSIIGNELVINLNGLGPEDQETFNTREAKIDDQVSTHRLNTFKVSGISNPSGFMNLEWAAGTQVFTIDSITLNGSAATINPIDPPNQPLPVELTSFNAVLNYDKVELNWQTATEVKNFGFEVQRKEPNAESWNKISFVEGHGNSNSPKDYRYVDNTLSKAGKYYYRLKQVDTDGTFEYSTEVEVDVVPTKYELSQNYPNPFNPSTKITFNMPEQGNVKLKIYNVLGNEVATLLDNEIVAGNHNVIFNATGLSSGVYYYRVEVEGKFAETKQMILIK